MVRKFRKFFKKWNRVRKGLIEKKDFCAGP